MDSFGDNIRKLRIEKGLPLRTVASFLDIDPAILSKVERGQRKASRNQVVQLARYFKVKADDLIVTWLSDRLVEDVYNESMALKALKVAEQRVAYKRYAKIGRREIIKSIKDYLMKDGRISRAWLFGSFARGEDNLSSDIDLMIEVPLESTFSLFDLADIQYQLEVKIPRKVDIVMKGGVRPHIMETIHPDLKIIYER